MTFFLGLAVAGIGMWLSAKNDRRCSPTEITMWLYGMVVGIGIGVMIMSM